MEEERIVAVGHGESLGVRTSIERWGAAIEEESGMCMRLAANNLQSGVSFLEAAWEYQIFMNT
jgi:hypothetical protein